MSSSISDRFITVDKAIASPIRTYYSVLNPISGISASPNQSIKFRLPASRAATYLDPSASFLSFKVTNNGPLDYTMSPVGAPGFFQNIVVRNQGSVLSTLNNYQTYRALHTKTNITEQYLGRDSAVLIGTSDVVKGQTMFRSGAVRSFADCLENYGSIFASGKYIPLFSQDSIELDILIGTLDYNLKYLNDVDVANHAKLGNNALVFSDLTLHLCMIEASPEVDSAIISAHPNSIFKYLTNNAASFQSYITQGAMSHQFQLGASFSSINAIHIVMVDSALGKHDLQNTSFVKSSLKNASILMDGYPLLSSTGIDTSSDAINLSYARVAQHALGDVTRFGHTANGSYGTESYIVSFDTETMFGKSETLRSGLDATGSTMNLKLEFSDLGAVTNLAVYVFIQYDAMVSMSLTEGRNWEVSI
jgi:hypothetical protein